MSNKSCAVIDEKSDEHNDLLSRLEMLSKENEALRQSNEESRKILDESLSKEIAKNNKLNVEIVKLKDYSQELASALEEEKKVKDQTLLRNAEISQLVQLSEQELKEQQSQSDELFKKISVLETQLESSQQVSLFTYDIYERIFFLLVENFIRNSEDWDKLLLRFTRKDKLSHLVVLWFRRQAMHSERHRRYF